MGARRAEDAMPQAFDKTFEFHRDDGLVFDDQDVGGEFACEFPTGLVDQFAQTGFIDAEDARCVSLAKSFHREQQEGLPRQRRDVGKLMLAGPYQTCMRSVAVDRDRVPYPGKQLVEADAWTTIPVDQAGIGHEGFQGSHYIRLAPRLAPRQRAAVTA